MTPARTGAAVSVTTWILLIASVLAMCARLITKFAVSRKYGVDDALAVSSLVGIPPLAAVGGTLTSFYSS